MFDENPLSPPRPWTRVLAGPVGRAGDFWRLCRFTPFDTSNDEGRSKERYRRVILSSATSVAARGVGILTGLVSVPLTIRYLGIERYGLWMTVTSLVAMLMFADLGIGNGLINAVSEADGRDDRVGARVAVSSAFYLLLGIAIGLSLLFAVAYPFIPWPRIFNVTSELARKESAVTAAALVVIFLANVPLGVVQKVQMGCQEGFNSNLWTAVGGLFGFGGLLLSVYFKAGLPWLVLALSGAPVLATAWNWHVFFGRSRPWLAPSRRAVIWVVAKRITGAGVVFALLQLFSLIGNWSDNLVIAQYLGASAVAGYAVTQKLFSVTLLAQFVTLPMWPAFGEAQARGDFRWARRALNRSLGVTLVLGVATAAPLLIFSKQIISLWAGPALVPSSLLLAGFGLWVLLAGYAGTMSAFLSSGPLLAKQIYIYGAASASAFGLKVLLVPRWGVAGAIWGTVLGYGPLYAVPATVLAYRTLSARLRTKEGSAG